MDVRTLKDRDLDDSDRRLLSDIETYGWHVVLIPEEDGTPGWAFSVGLYSTFRKPEIIVFGLPQAVSHHLINTVGEWARSGQTVSETDLYSGLIDKFPCTFRPVASQWYRNFVGAAGWYYRRAEFPLLQCFWPDRDEQFPWSPKFRASWLWAQPLLYNTTRESARVDHLLKSMGD
jgi:hypothetical protein